MIDAVMYGMMPRAKMANWLSAPPENRLRKPMRALLLGLVLELLHGLVVDAGHRDGGAEPVEHHHQQGEQDLAPKVRDLEDVLQAREHSLAPWRVAARRSADQRLVNWLPLAGGRPVPNGRGSTSTYPLRP